MDDLEEKENPEEEKPTFMVFVKAGLVGLLQALGFLLFAWLVWQSYDNSPSRQVQKLLDQQK